MAFYAVDSIEAPGAEADSALQDAVQLAKNMTAIASERPLLSAATWTTAQRWHAPFPVFYGPFWAGYSETPIDTIAVHVSHDGRVSSTGESNPAGTDQAVHVYAVAIRPGERPAAPPESLDDWSTADAGAKVTSTTGDTFELTVDARNRRGLVGIVIWVQSEFDSTASHTVEILDRDVHGALITDTFTSPSLNDVAPERAAVIRPSLSDNKSPNEPAGLLHWAEYVVNGQGANAILHVSPPAPEPSWSLYTDEDVVDLYPMGVLQVESVLVEATPVYTGPSPDLFAPDRRAYASGPLAAANWLRGRWEGHRWALHAQSGAPKGVAPWGARLQMSTTYQANPGDGGMHPGFGPAPITFRAHVGLVGVGNPPEFGNTAAVDLRLVVHDVPPGTADANGTAVRATLDTPLAINNDHLRRSLFLLHEFEKWSSRGTLWPATIDGQTGDDILQIQRVECEVDSSSVEKARVIRPEIKVANASREHYVWWVGGTITYRADVLEGDVYIPNGGDEWGFRVGNDTGRPADTMGTSITPGANDAKGSWTQLLTALAQDVYLVQININSGNVNAAARPILVDIGTDEAGGSSYTVVIPNLIGCCAGGYLGNSSGDGGITYEFPLRIPAGATVAARAQVGNATAGTVYVKIDGYGAPRDPRTTRYGDTVTAYGVTTASSDGTSVTSGTTSEGAWTELGTVSTEEPWGWQVMSSSDDGSMNLVSYAIALGIGQSGSEEVVIKDQPVWESNAERMSSPGSPVRIHETQSGDKVYGRAQCSGTASGSFSMAAWGIGGP